MGNKISTNTSKPTSNLLSKNNTEIEDCDATLSIEQKKDLLSKYKKEKNLQKNTTLKSNLAELGLEKPVDEIEASVTASEARRNKNIYKEALGGKKGIKTLKKELKKQDQLNQPSSSKD
ncbi:hypothetical protein ACFX5K_06170 [Rickettsiales bacterium LUAb2]